MNYALIVSNQFVGMAGYYLTCVLAGTKFRWKILLVCHLVSYALMLGLEHVGVYLGLFAPFVPDGSVQPYILLSNAVDILALIGVLYFILKKELYISIITSGFAMFIMDGLRSFTSIFRMAGFYLTGMGTEFGISYFLYPVIIVISAIVLKKTRFSRIIPILAAMNKKKILAAAFLLPNLSILVLLFMDVYNKYLVESYYVYNIMPLLVMVITITGIYQLVISYARKEKLLAQESMLVQQEMHMKNLEKLQQEMRLFRHDYKNMMLSMYLKAEEGRQEEVQKMIQEATGGFEASVDASIYQEVQLMRIHIVEVKSLIMAKIVEMQKRGIDYNLEVMYPLDYVNIRDGDLSRCLGILLDNAMDEAEKIKGARIDIMLSSEEDKVTVIVKNPVKDKVALRDIWKFGHSSKGKERGLGLYSYKKILSKYDNVLSNTKIEQEMFIQELQILKG